MPLPSRAARRIAVLGLTAVGVFGAGLPLVAGPAAAAGPATAAGAEVGPTHPLESSAPEPEFHPQGGIADDRVLVSVAPDVTSAQVDAIVTASGGTLEAHSADTLIIEPAAGDFAAASGRLDALPGVEGVSPNHALHSFMTPDDPLFESQYGLWNNQPGGIRAESAWNDTTGSRSVVVGVLDSGLTLNHPDLVANLWVNRTGINGCPYGTSGWDAITEDCTPNDNGGHGTHVAGVLGAVGNNGIGVSGVAQRVSIMGLKMLNRHGDGTEADAIEAIAFALAAKEQGVNLEVLQASWGGTGSAPALSNAIAAADAAGVLFVTAAGNQKADLDAGGVTVSPCEDPNPNVICVGASNASGALWTSVTSGEGSNYGATAVDLAAPGADIVSTVPRDVVPGCLAGSYYCAFDGTSMAAPMVSGAAVNILAAEPSLSTAQVKARILASTTALGGLAGKVATGGRLDVCRAIPNCDGLPAVPPTKPNNVRAAVGNGSVTIKWAKPDSNGNSFLVTGYDIEGPNGITSVGFSTLSTTLTGLTNNQNATVRVRAFGTGGTGPWVSRTIRPHGGGYVIDGQSGIHRVGTGGAMPSPPTLGASFPVANPRGIAIVPEGTGGYVVDRSGKLSRFRIGASSPLPPVPTGGATWPGQDVVRGVAVSPTGGGYVLDLYGGLHPFGYSTQARPGPAIGAPYWPGFDIARGVTFRSTGNGGYVVDGYGGIHRFRIGGAKFPPAATGGTYWPAWDIARGITLVPGSGGGYVLDGFGGIHRFAAGGAAPPAPSSGPYWPGWDIARGLSL